jgi:hypothetical protein
MLWRKDSQNSKKEKLINGGKGDRKMPDKAGGRFADIKGGIYELRHDPQGGHLRPYTVKDTNNNWLAAILALVITTVLVGGSRWIWNKITKRKR